MRAMKLAILHDYFNKMGGGERVVLTLAKNFKSTIFTGFVNWNKTYEDLKNFDVRIIGKDLKIHLLTQWSIAKTFEKYKFSGYDIVICSGTWTIPASKNHPSIWYSHTPARWLYDLKDYFLSNSNIIQYPFLKAFINYWKNKDQKYVHKFDHIIANSLNVKKRILRFYGKNISKKLEIVYPPVNINKFKWKGQEDYYLSFGRLDKLKRIEVIVKAFMKMPNKNLVIASSGPEYERIKRLAKGYENIRIVGQVSEDELITLLGKCIATIYIPINEDFGISPVESMAAGKPVIGVDDGGLKETIIHKKTGYMCRSNLTASDLIDAVKWLTPEKAKKMRNNCRKRAEIFSEENFIKRMKKIINKFC